MRGLLILLIFCASGAAARPAAHAAETPAEAVRLQAFLDRAEPLCAAKSAKTCVDAGWKFAAPAPGRGLTQADVAVLQWNLQAWYAWRQGDLSPRDRTSVGFGLLLARGVGAERLHRAFDKDGDGLVTQKELLADVALDKRPLGAVLSDPKAVDRAALARRLSLPDGLLDHLFPH